MNNLAIRENTTPSQSEFQIMLQQSEMLVKTNFLPPSIKTKEQALAIILTGRELGIPSMAALNTINVIQNKPTVSPQLMLALIERSGQLEDIKIDTKGDSVSCTMKRKGRSPHTETFGKAEATALNLIGKDNYKKQPLTMYRWRAVASCARVVFPDVILGLYTPDEMGAEVTEDGEVKAAVAEFPRSVESAPKVIIDAEVMTDPHETFSADDRIVYLQIEETLKDYIDFLGFNSIKTTTTINKMASFGSIDECKTALEKVAVAYYAKKIEDIKGGLSEQNWDIEEVNSYLEQFDVAAIDEATREQIDVLYADMQDGKMI